MSNGMNGRLVFVGRAFVQLPSCSMPEILMMPVKPFVSEHKFASGCIWPPARSTTSIFKLATLNENL